MISKQALNLFLRKGRQLADLWEAEGKHDLAVQAIQITSRIALPYVPKAEKVVCSCGKWLRIGKEVEFYNHTNHCYSCESAYIESYNDMM